MDALTTNNLKPLRCYFQDNIKEVVINRPGEVYLEALDGEWIVKKDKKLSKTWFEGMARIMATASSQKFNTNNPLLSFKLPEGHRVQIISGSLVSSGMAMTIRLHRNKIFSLDDYGLKSQEKEALISAVKESKTILISGGTGTGKTSFLNVLLSFIKPSERLITIEGVPELKSSNQNWVSLLYSENKSSSSATDVTELLNATLRMRPDRIVLGELRKENSFTFTRAINTGHEGTIATIHSNSPYHAITALVTNIIMNGDAESSSMPILVDQLTQDIYGVVQLKREGKEMKGYFQTL
ncbi:MAG: Flp pilus assembly complex ATPase component TadA [Rickettsiales bacterium]|nr:Flp pilus assembly complex ATPase component TadA [Rickettsiales bacterium]